MNTATITVFVGLATIAACSEAGVSLVPQAALQDPAESPAFFEAAVDYVAATAGSRVTADPRPLRRDADLAGIDRDDLATDADAVARVRRGVLESRGVAQSDAVEDFRCVFSAGVGVPPSREPTLADSIRQRRAHCRARDPYTTLIFGLPEREQDERDTWRIEAVVLTKGGFQILDLFLQPAAGAWQVTSMTTRFQIWS